LTGRRTSRQVDCSVASSAARLVWLHDRKGNRREVAPCRRGYWRSWILGAEAPTFVRAESPLFSGGPLWRIELVPRPCGDEPIVRNFRRASSTRKVQSMVRPSFSAARRHAATREVDQKGKAIASEA